MTRTAGAALHAAIAAGFACTLLSACTSAPVTPSASPSSTTATPTPAVVKINGLPPEKPSKATVVLDDPTLVRAVPDDQPYGPTTFYIDGNTITVYDVLTNKFAVYRNGKRSQTINFPQYVCLDLLIHNGHYWALVRDQNFTYTVIDYQLASTNKLIPAATYPIDQGQPAWLWAEGDSIVLEAEGGELSLVAGPGPLTPEPLTAEHGKIARIETSQATTEITSRYQSMGAQLLARTAQYAYHWVVDLGPRSNRGWIYQLTPTGELAHTYTLPPAGALDPNRPIQIAPDGQVYEMVVTNKTARIYRIAPNP